MARPDTVVATLAGKGIAERAIALAVDLARADEDTTGVWADSARRKLTEIEGEIVRLKRELAKLPTASQGSVAEAA